MMFPDGSMSREYEFSAGPLDDAYTLWVEEHIDITRTHIALVELRLNGMLLLKVRIGVRADGVLVLGPKEYSLGDYKLPATPPVAGRDRLT